MNRRGWFGVLAALVLVPKSVPNLATPEKGIGVLRYRRYVFRDYCATGRLGFGGKSSSETLHIHGNVSLACPNPESILVVENGGRHE